jgi:hypothetical protein
MHPMHSKAQTDARLLSLSLEPPDLASPDKENDGPTVSQQVQRLRDITARIETFLLRQMERLERTLEQWPAAPSVGSESLQRMMEDFEYCKKTWEVERTRELERIQQDSARLADCWLKLEAEQRRALSERQPLPGKQASLAVPQSIAEAYGLGKKSKKKTDEAISAEHKSGGNGADSTTPELDLLEFQQLKREIQKHIRRH